MEALCRVLGPSHVLLQRFLEGDFGSGDKLDQLGVSQPAQSSVLAQVELQRRRVGGSLGPGSIFL